MCRSVLSSFRYATAMFAIFACLAVTAAWAESGNHPSPQNNVFASPEMLSLVAGCQEDALWVEALTDRTLRAYGSSVDRARYEILYLAMRELFSADSLAAACVQGVQKEVAEGNGVQIRYYVLRTEFGEMMTRRWQQIRTLEQRLRLETEAQTIQARIVDPRRLEQVDALEQGVLWKKVEALWRTKIAQAVAVGLNSLRPIASQMALAAIEQHYQEQELAIAATLNDFARATLLELGEMLSNKGHAQYVEDMSKQEWVDLWHAREAAWRTLLTRRIEQIGAKVVSDWHLAAEQARRKKYEQAALAAAAASAAAGVETKAEEGAARRPRRPGRPKTAPAPQGTFKAPAPPPLRTEP